MVFSSAVFLLLFLPLFLVVYYLVPFKRKSLVILIGSYIFYGWWRVDFLALFAAVTYFSYWVTLRMSRLPAETPEEQIIRHRKRWLAIGVAGNLLVLGYFKYFNFGVDSFNAALLAAGFTPMEAWKVILPIGISFYVFQSVSYVIDVYRGDAEIAPSFLDFAAFIALFPQLIAGPVLRYKDVAHQFYERTHTLDKFNEGAIRFSVGFCKKVMIADTVAPIADMMFAQANPSFSEAWLGILAYSIQLYFDFSGYSDMAIGLGLMMGFRFIENFNHPYISRSITEFWRRWHISLSTWLRDYLYIPLGGNKKGKVRTYINLLLTMILGGAWHGANWTFVLWGTWHGAILALERLIGGRGGAPYPRLLALPLTLLMVMIGWVLFRAPNVSTAFGFYEGMLGLNGFGIADTLVWQITPLHLAALAGGWVIVFLAPWRMRHFNVQAGHLGPTWAYRVSVAGQCAVVAVMAVGVSKMIAQSFSPFLYFQF